MRLSPCRFNLPLRDNDGRPIDSQVVAELHRELIAQFGGFTVHPTSQGRWQSRAGQLYQEEIAVYEVAVPVAKVPLLREIVTGLGRLLGQLAMYFDAPPPSVEIIEITEPSETAKASSDEPKQGKTTRRRGKKNRPSG